MADARETFDRATEAINRHDLEALGPCYSPDAVVVTPDGKFEGRDGALAMLEVWFEAFPDMKVTSWSKVTSGDVVVDEWTMTGTNTGPLPTPEGTVLAPTGRSVSIRGTDVGIVENGAITSHRLYWDNAEFLAQLGLLGQPETVG